MEEYETQISKFFKGFINQNNVVGFFREPIKLKSERMSNWYVNWRTITEDVHLTDVLSDFVIDFTKENQLEPSCFYGVPEGATKLGIITQFKWAKEKLRYYETGIPHVLAMGRGKPKDHGDEKDRYFLGVPKGSTIILEDVTTTGDSLLKEIEKLQGINVNVIAALGLTHRMEKRDDGLTVQEAIKTKTGVDYFSLSNAIDLLPLAYEKQRPREDIARAVEEEFEKYGERKLKLL